MGPKGNRGKLKIVQDELNWVQTSLSIGFLPFYILIVIGKLFFNVLIGPPRYPNRMVGITRIILMFSLISYASGFIFEKHENFLLKILWIIGLKSETTEIISAFIWLGVVLNIVFQFIYVVVLGASTERNGESYLGEGRLPGSSDNGMGRAMRGLDYELGMKNSREGQKEVMRDWFGGEK